MVLKKLTCYKKQSVLKGTMPMRQLDFGKGRIWDYGYEINPICSVEELKKILLQNYKNLGMKNYAKNVRTWE